MEVQLRRPLAIALVVVAGVLAGAAPAQAHPVNLGADPTNWRSTITAIPPGGVLTARLGDDAMRITVVARSAAPVIVLGYDGEPFLRLTKSSAWRNDRSSTTWATAFPRRVPPPSVVNDKATPQWRQLSTTGRWTWHDLRTHWAGYAPPASVSRHPGRVQYVSDWSIPLVVDGQRALLSGRIDWVPGPQAAPGLTLTLLAFGVMVAIAAARRWRVPTAAAVIAVVALDAAHSWGMVVGRVGSGWTKLSALPAHGGITLAMLMTLLTCAGALVRRRHLTAATYGVAMIAAVIFLADAIPSVPLVWRSQAITGMPVGLDRVLVAVLTGASAGLLVCVCLLIRRHDRPPVHVEGNCPS